MTARLLSGLATRHRVARDEGASGVEYALLVFAIAAVIVAVVFTVGLYVRNMYSNTCTTIAGQVSAPGDPACS